MFDEAQALSIEEKRPSPIDEDQLMRITGVANDEKRNSQEELSEGGQAEIQDTCYLSAELE